MTDPAAVKEAASILDVACGPQMFWFDKDDPRVIFMDRRKESHTLSNGHELIISPDIVADFRNIPFPDNRFSLVVFDPPHLIRAGGNCDMVKKYGLLQKTWKSDLKQGFDECMRVLRPNGILIFKWGETDIPVNRLITIFGQTPLFGQRTAKTTIWCVFLKEGGGGILMRVLLIDVDSKIPNLALMKVSGYHKTLGDTVGFNISDPEKIYVSVIFKKNAHKVDGLKALYPNAKINIGGSGYDIKKKLPVDIEYTSPVDYSIYPNNDSYYGFTSRGCIRKCHFCIVPQKEGKWHASGSVETIINPITYIYDKIPCIEHIGAPPEGYKKLTLLDNNILADKDHFLKMTAQIPPDMKVDFNQGLDIRLIDREIADRIKTLHPINQWKFAFDSLSYGDKVEHGIRILKKAGINVRNSAIFYVYCHDDEDFDSALDRCNMLRNWGTGAYLMINQDAPRTQRMTNLKRWCRPQIYWSLPFAEYRKRNKETRIGMTDIPPMNVKPLEVIE